MIFFRFTILILVSIVFCTITFGQQKDRIIKRSYWKSEPIKIITTKVRDNSVNFKEKFIENDDWLRNFSIEVKNVSSQTIVFLEIKLDFPQDENGMPEIPASESLRYGVMPLPTGERPNFKPSEPPLLPDNTATLKVNNYKALQKLLDYAGHSKSVEKITISIGRVVFADGKTMWNGGQIFKRNKNDPGRWSVEQKQQSSTKSGETLKKILFKRTSNSSVKTVSSEPLGFMLPYKPPIKSLSSLAVTQQIRCQEWIDTLNKQCNNYACHVVNNLQGQETGSNTVGWWFRQRTLRCERDDNGEDCFAYNTAWEAYFDCSSTANEDDCFDSCPEGFICLGNRCSISPIIIDVQGNGFNLTDSENGVDFDIGNERLTRRTSWTSADSDDALLALDRNGNSKIDNGAELFGTATAQPASTEKNGFLALAEFDKSTNGGNNDGAITNQDTIFSSLRLWQDKNHNGISEATELNTLNDLGLAKIELSYHESKRTDEHGNSFRYRAKVRDAQGTQLSRWAWDVFLVVQTAN